MANHVYGKRWPGPGQRYPAADTSSLSVKAEVDPRRVLPPVFDQGQLGSCTANATTACFQFDAIMDRHDCGLLSRRWVYHFEKVIEGTSGQGDTGAIGHDAFRVAEHGIPAEKLWPYTENIAEVETKPPDVEPRAYRLSKPVHAPAQSQNPVKQVLSNNQTIAFGFVVYESFEDSSWWWKGLMPMPSPSEGVLGGHEVLAVGYLKAYPHHVLCRNSWGTSFALEGYWLMPWAFFLDPNYCSDFRTIVRSV